MKKSIITLVVMLTAAALWAEDSRFRLAGPEEKSTDYEKSEFRMNERYYRFISVLSNGEEQRILADSVSDNQLIFDINLWIPDFEIHGYTPVLIKEKYFFAYLSPDLSTELFTDKSYFMGYPFYDGAAIVAVEPKNSFALIDVNGEIIRDDIWSSSGTFSEGVVYCGFKDGSAGFIDNYGKIKIPVPKEYKSEDSLARYTKQENRIVLHTPDWQTYAVMDENGTILLTTDRHLENNFTGGYLAFAEEHKNQKVYYGYMDKDFNIVVPARYKTEFYYRKPSFENWKKAHPYAYKIYKKLGYIKE